MWALATASPGGGEGLNFYISTNSAFKTRARQQGRRRGQGGGRHRSETAAADRSGARWAVAAGGEHGWRGLQTGRCARRQRLHAERWQRGRRHANCAWLSLVAQRHSQRGKAAARCIRHDPLMFDSSFLLRSESSASTFSLPGTTISLHPFTSAAGNHSLLPPQPTTYHNAAAAAAAAALAAAQSAAAGHKIAGGGALSRQAAPAAQHQDSHRLAPVTVPVAPSVAESARHVALTLAVPGATGQQFQLLCAVPATVHSQPVGQRRSVRSR